MVAKLGWSLRPAAHVDLSSIWRYGAEKWGPDQADYYADALFAVFDLLAGFPEMARERDMFDPPIRIHPTRAHLILYQTVEEGIEIIRILHAAQNLSEFLAES